MSDRTFWLLVALIAVFVLGFSALRGRALVRRRRREDRADEIREDVADPEGPSGGSDGGASAPH